MKVKVEFSGGLEMMFNNLKQIDIDLDAESPCLIDLFNELRSKHLQEKEVMFIQKGTVRPGIIVLIIDTETVDRGVSKRQHTGTGLVLNFLAPEASFVDGDLTSGRLSLSGDELPEEVGVATHHDGRLTGHGHFGFGQIAGVGFGRNSSDDLGEQQHAAYDAQVS